MGLMITKQNFLLYIRNFVFGAEDSLVSTVGLLAGVTSAGLERSGVIISGIVLIFVEAFSMGVGSFLSQQTVDEYGKNPKTSSWRSARGGIIMFLSYLIAGFIPLLPYVLMDLSSAFRFSIVLSLVALFILGIVSAKALHTPIWRNGRRMLLVGGMAVAIGIIVGLVFK